MREDGSEGRKEGSTSQDTGQSRRVRDQSIDQGERIRLFDGGNERGKDFIAESQAEEEQGHAGAIGSVMIFVVFRDKVVIDRVFGGEAKDFNGSDIHKAIDDG